jgi:hypothetical protein
MSLTNVSIRCTPCGRRNSARRITKAVAPAPLLDWAARQARLLVVTPPSATRPTLRLHLTMAAEARRRGDYGAAAIHETDAILAQRAEQATARRSMGAPR